VSDLPEPLYRREVRPPRPADTWPRDFYPQGCPCKACVPEDMDPFSFAAQFHLCPTCGNKRCPGAADHRNTCTGSNEPGQPGSLYEHRPLVDDRAIVTWLDGDDTPEEGK